MFLRYNAVLEPLCESLISKVIVARSHHVILWMHTLDTKGNIYLSMGNKSILE